MKCCWRSSDPSPESFELSQASCVAPILDPWSSELLTATLLKDDRGILDCCCCWWWWWWWCCFCGCGCGCCCRCWWLITLLFVEWRLFVATVFLETNGAVTVDDVPPALLPVNQIIVFSSRYHKSIVTIRSVFLLFLFDEIKRIKQRKSGWWMKI